MTDLLKLELGDYYWKLSGKDVGFSFNSEQRALEYAKENNIEGVKAYCVDTRAKLSDIARVLNQLEEHIWTEGGISVFPTIKYDGIEDIWPNPWNSEIVINVREGSNEGIYIYIEHVDNKSKRTILFSGKTCDSSLESWTNCWASAGRIARLLTCHC